MSVEEVLGRDGFGWARCVLTVEEVAEWIAYLGDVTGAGQRGWLKDARVEKLSLSERLKRLYEPVLGERGRLVRVIYFDKTPESNWFVTWHQDLSIAVRQKVEVVGYGPWSVKDGVWHVQPPVRILENMLTLRIHFDLADETNGCLRVVPGSHNLGKLDFKDISRERENRGEVSCVAGVGDVLMMRPLLLHASGRAKSVVDQGRRSLERSRLHRRVLHLEFAGMELESGLDWV